MATAQEFQTMLNEFLTIDLLRSEIIPQDYILSQIEKDDNWKGGTLPVPFQGATASSIAFGELTAATGISQSKYVRGSVSGYKEVWGSLIFNQRDLMEHGKVSEQNFLRLLPDEITNFASRFRSVVSVNLLNGAHFAKATADGDASGNLTVDRPDRFEIGQECYVMDDNSAVSSAAYVLTINSNTKVVNFVTTRGGATPVNLSAYTLAQNAKVYNKGATTVAFSSLRDALLSSANGGSASLYGVTKTAYPHLQARNVDGSGVTATNIVEKIFDAYTEIKQTSRGGSPKEVLMSYKNFGSCLKVIEGSKGAYNVVPKDKSAQQFAWDMISIGSVTGNILNLVGVMEMDDDIIIFLDWRSIMFASNGMFMKNKTPDGLEYFTVRDATNGYQYIVDICLYGELITKRPNWSGIMYGISYT